MLVVGTPRPSSSILGEVADNGFFEKSFEGGGDGEEQQDNNDDLNDDDLWGNNNNNGRGVRSRSESFHEMKDEMSVTSSPIVLSGSQPLLTRQLNIVTNLSPTTYEARPRPWGAPTKEECLEEELLEKEETALLDKWRSVGGKGRPDPPPPHLTSNKNKRSGSHPNNNTTSSALVPSVGSTPVQGNTVNMELLPRYEDLVRVFVLSTPVTPNQGHKIEWRTREVVESPRRVRTQVWELHPSAQAAQPPDESVMETYLQGSDAVVCLTGQNEWTNKILARARALDRVVVVTGLYGQNISDARKQAQRIGAHFDQKGAGVWAELAARDVVLKNAKIRGEPKSVLQQMEKQFKKCEKAAAAGKSSNNNGGSTCQLM